MELEEKISEKTSFVNKRDSYDIVGIEKRSKGGTTVIVKDAYGQILERPINGRNGKIVTLLLDQGSPSSPEQQNCNDFRPK